MFTKGIFILFEPKNTKWDKRFLEMAQGVSKWSKDPSRQIGAIAVKNRNVIAQGYNGFPRGIDDDPVRYDDREMKYKYVVHAEMNCIFNASFNGVSLEGSDLYVWGLPICSDCAKGIIQVGVERVVMPEQDVPPHWKESWNFSKSMFKEAGVKWKFLLV